MNSTAAAAWEVHVLHDGACAAPDHIEKADRTGSRDPDRLFRMVKGSVVGL